MKHPQEQLDALDREVTRLRTELARQEQRMSHGLGEARSRARAKSDSLHKRLKRLAGQRLRLQERLSQS